MANNPLSVSRERVQFITDSLARAIPREWQDNDTDEITPLARPRLRTLREHVSLPAATLTNAIASVVWDMLDRGGKRWRSVLYLLVLDAFDVQRDVLRSLCAVAELIHCGTLLIDDVEDDSPTRRGQPSAHIRFGVDVAINAGNTLYFLPVRLLNRALSGEVLARAMCVYSEEMCAVHLGQGLDIWWHRNDASGVRPEPSESDYLIMCAGKTGALARMAVRLAAVVANQPPSTEQALARFAEAAGVAFQILDDLLSVDGSAEYYASKGMRGEDIHEGKRSLMVVHALANATPDRAARLQEILALTTTDEALIDEAIGILRETQSLTYARETARRLVGEAIDELRAVMPEGEPLDKLVAFANFLIERTT